eukprot:5608297-Alexandrium_andersonii.AAC.1
MSPGSKCKPVIGTTAGWASGPPAWQMFAGGGGGRRTQATARRHEHRTDCTGWSPRRLNHRFRLEGGWRQPADSKGRGPGPQHDP